MNLRRSSLELAPKEYQLVASMSNVMDGSSEL